eukprot:7252675-Pyramimonas_sp.AAC.1
MLRTGIMVAFPTSNTCQGTTVYPSIAVAIQRTSIRVCVALARPPTGAAVIDVAHLPTSIVLPSHPAPVPLAETSVRWPPPASFAPPNLPPAVGVLPTVRVLVLSELRPLRAVSTLQQS